jgi:phosphoribosyl-ATP pyrophosphohydrolase
VSERYITPSALPSEHERELLTILIEECAEVQQRATKLLRFGATEIQPGQEKTNSERLANEIGDLVHMTTLLDQVGLIPNRAVQAGMRNKQKQLARFMQTSATTDASTKGDE